MRSLTSAALVRAPLGVAIALLVTAGACIAGAPGAPIHRVTDDGAGGEATIDVDASAPDAGDLGNTDPHAVLGVDPPHGSFLGGQDVVVHGKGFAATVRVWIGETEATDVQPIDTTRVQVKAPPGKAGPADVTAQNGGDESTKRTLASGYVYDNVYAEPDSGPVSGGTVIEIFGQGTHWDETTVATIDQKPCTELKLDSPTQLACTVPQGTPGSKPISVKTGDELLTVLDGYTYEDSDNGFKGGLSGSPLDGQLKVLVYDNYSGAPIPGAHAIAGGNLATALIEDTGPSGVALITDPSLNGPTTVTIAAYCHSPISFVAVTVDTVTAYIDPVQSPVCGSGGDIPPVGGKPQHVGTVTGEIFWDGGVEFKKAPWTNIPSPKSAEERQVAYVFVAGGDPTQPFLLPDPTTAVLPDAPGDIGYAFASSMAAGNRALYALAGIENRVAIPNTFTAYAMGVARGVPVVPNDTTENVYIPMRSTLDQALKMTVTTPPPGPKGPDRLRATVALMLGNDGYALLPVGLQVPYLPVQGELSFVGVPSLTGDLFGSNYLSTARAATGPSLQAPLSVIARMLSTTTSQVVNANGFVGVPTLVTPGVNAGWDGMHLATSFAAVGTPIDMTVYDITSGNGLMHWLVTVPGGTHSIELPQLGGYDMASLPHGPLVMAVYGARINNFNYGKLLYRDMRPTGMSAYSLDYFASHL